MSPAAGMRPFPAVIAAILAPGATPAAHSSSGIVTPGSEVIDPTGTETPAAMPATWVP